MPLLFLSSAVRRRDAAPRQRWPRRADHPRTTGRPSCLALASQVLGQGLLVYGIGTFPPLIVGLALLTQPAISAVVGWFAYGERLSPVDWIGALAIAAALVLVRLPERGLRTPAEQPS